MPERGQPDPAAGRVYRTPPRDVYKRQHLGTLGVTVERKVELVGFTDTGSGVTAMLLSLIHI